LSVINTAHNYNHSMLTHKEQAPVLKLTCVSLSGVLIARFSKAHMKSTI